MANTKRDSFLGVDNFSRTSIFVAGLKFIFSYVMNIQITRENYGKIPPLDFFIGNSIIIVIMYNRVVAKLNILKGGS